MTISRRAFVGTLALVGPALAGCAATSTVVVAPLTTTTPQVRTDWTRRPDGPLPTSGDEGVPIRAVHVDRTAAPASVRGGALVGNLPDEQGAVYVVQQLPAPVRVVGARFGFTAGEESGSLCLAAWTGPPPTETNCHMVVTPERWIFAVAKDNALIVLDDGSFPVALEQDGRSYRLQVDLDGGPTAILQLPDGQTRKVVDARIGETRGTVANWEFYKDAAGAADVRLYETWAA